MESYPARLVFGGDVFRRELLAQMDGHIGEHHYGAERSESAEAKAERLVQAGLKTARWTEEDLRLRRKSDEVKIRLAAQLRQETTMTLKWIAERLRMGSWSYVANNLYQSAPRTR